MAPATPLASKARSISCANFAQRRAAASGRELWIGTLDYVGGCSNTHQAKIVFARSRAHGFSPSVSDASAGQNVVCYWGSNGRMWIKERD